MPEAKARLDNGQVVFVECSSQRACRDIDPEGPDPLEVAYRVVRGLIEVEGLGTGWGPALSMLERLKVPVDLFIVYYDLRRRGRRVRSGIRQGTLIVESGSRRFEVLVLSLGARTRLSSIIDWSELAVADDREPVIAVVDGHGSVTYYTARAAGSIR